jgi:hypothetical protein
MTDAPHDAPPFDAAELALLGETLPLALAPVRPSAMVREGLLAALDPNPRLSRWTERLASFFEVAHERAAMLLARIEVAAAWAAGPLEGVGLMHTEGGPALAGADVGLVRFPAGMAWPLHRHIGAERMLLLEGGLVEADGRAWRAGEIIDMPAGSEHSFIIDADGPCVAAVIVWEGIELPPGRPLRV